MEIVYPPSRIRNQTTIQRIHQLGVVDPIPEKILLTVDLRFLIAKLSADHRSLEAGGPATHY